MSPPKTESSELPRASSAAWRGSAAAASLRPRTIPRHPLAGEVAPTAGIYAPLHHHRTSVTQRRLLHGPAPFCGEGGKISCLGIRRPLWPARRGDPPKGGAGGRGADRRPGGGPAAQIGGERRPQTAPWGRRSGKCTRRVGFGGARYRTQRSLQAWKISCKKTLPNRPTVRRPCARRA